MSTTQIYPLLNLKCGGCVSSITKGVESIYGISNVNVLLEDSTVQFDYSSNDQLEAVHQKLNSMGYPINQDENSLLKKAKSYVSCAIGRMED